MNTSLLNIALVNAIPLPHNHLPPKPLNLKKIWYLSDEYIPKCSRDWISLKHHPLLLKPPYKPQIVVSRCNNRTNKTSHPLTLYTHITPPALNKRTFNQRWIPHWISHTTPLPLQVNSVWFWWLAHIIIGVCCPLTSKSADDSAHNWWH